MSNDLTRQGDELIAALSAAVSKGWHREYERPHGQPEGEVIEGQSAVDPMQGRGQYWASVPASGDDLDGQLREVLGLGQPMRLKRI